MPAMLLLLVSVVAALALAAPAPRTQKKRMQVNQAPNVVLVASDSFVSTQRTGSRHRPEPVEKQHREQDPGVERSRMRTPASTHVHTNKVVERSQSLTPGLCSLNFIH